MQITLTNNYSHVFQKFSETVELREKTGFSYVQQGWLHRHERG